MSTDPAVLLSALDELDRALEEFRTAYADWLAGARDADALALALASAEARLDAARSALASADGQSHPS